MPGQGFRPLTSCTHQERDRFYHSLSGAARESRSIWAENAWSKTLTTTGIKSKPGMGFFPFATAWRTLQGYEAIHMIRKGQVQGVHKGETSRQAIFIAELFGVAI
jgi:hypothetical protein